MDLKAHYSSFEINAIPTHQIGYRNTMEISSKSTG